MQISKRLPFYRCDPFQFTVLVTSRLLSLRVSDTPAVALLPSTGTATAEAGTTTVHSPGSVSSPCSRRGSALSRT